ncbi:hypothetical protein O9X98_14715 [Agrobacterium salinitolerans]|nr:hypothetical protein [Agrobacterium salinitolerans]
MVTEYFGAPADPTPEEQELTLAENLLIAKLRAETERSKLALGPVLKMHGDVMAGFVAYDEFDAVTRASSIYSANKRKVEAALEKSERHHSRIGLVVFAALVVSIVFGFQAGAGTGVLLFLFVAIPALVLGIMEPMPDSVRQKLRELSLVRTLEESRPLGPVFGGLFSRGDQTLDIEWLGIGNGGLSFLDGKDRATYVDYSDISSVFANTDKRQVSFMVKRPKGHAMTVNLTKPQADDLLPTRARHEDTVADFIADKIASSRTKVGLPA